MPDNMPPTMIEKAMAKKIKTLKIDNTILNGLLVRFFFELFCVLVEAVPVLEFIKVPLLF